MTVLEIIVRFCLNISDTLQFTQPVKKIDLFLYGIIGYCNLDDFCLFHVNRKLFMSGRISFIILPRIVDVIPQVRLS